MHDQNESRVAPVRRVAVFARWWRTTPAAARLYALAITLLALAESGWGVAVDGSWGDAKFLAALAAGGMITYEMGTAAAGGRQQIVGQVQWGFSAWPFAAAVLVGPTLAGLVAICTYLYAYCRGQRPQLRKWLASCAIVILSAWAAGAVFTLIVGSTLRPEGSATQLGSVAAAIVVYLAVEVLLFFVKTRLDPPDEAAVHARLRTGDFYFSEAAVLATGAGAAVLCRYWPGFLVLLLPLLLVQPRGWLYLPLQQEAQHDPKTRLLNNLVWRQSAEATADRQRATGRPYAVMFIDVDHFKTVNDSYGHVVGDEVLIGVAGELIRSTRPTDLVGRYGGDEFCVLLSEADAPRATEVAERLRAGIAGLRFSIRGVHVTVSIGVAVKQPAARREDDEDLSCLMIRADRALYRAKNAGRDSVGI